MKYSMRTTRKSVSYMHRFLFGEIENVGCFFLKGEMKDFDFHQIVEDFYNFGSQPPPPQIISNTLVSKYYEHKILFTFVSGEFYYLSLYLHIYRYSNVCHGVRINESKYAYQTDAQANNIHEDLQKNLAEKSFAKNTQPTLFIRPPPTGELNP